MKKYFKQFMDVYLREFKLVKSDAGLLIFFLFLPFAYPIVYSLIYNPELVRDVPIVVIDNDRTPDSRRIVRMLDATQEAWVKGYAANLPEGKRAMMEHDVYAILEIPEGFGRKIGRKEPANAVMYCDMSLLLRYRGLLVASTNVMTEMGAELTTDRLDNIAPLAATIATSGDPMPVSNISMGNIEGGFDSFVMPGVLILIFQQTIVLAVGMAGGAKRERAGIVGYNPVNYAPSVWMTMLAQMACYVTVLLVPIIFLVHYVPLIFAFPMAGSNLEIFAFLLPMMLASMALGFIFQGVVRERETVFVLWVATSVIFLFLSGLTWPRYAMASVWKYLGDLVPATWGVEGFIRMNSNGASLAQASHEYIALWIMTGAYLLVAYCVQRWIVRPAEKREGLTVGVYGPVAAGPSASAGASGAESEQGEG